MLLFAMGSVLGLSAFAQAGSQATMVLESVGPVSTYRVVVISRSVQAVNYRHRSGATDVDFAGTALLPSADGKAKVRSKRGTMEVEAEFGNLQSPATFGGEYLTYVLWAISPEGRAVNLGEVLVGDNDRSKLTATTDRRRSLSSLPRSRTMPSGSPATSSSSRTSFARTPREPPRQ